MKLFPAIDLYDGKAVRLFKGDYAQMTVYRDDPLDAALEFGRAGAEWMHMVDLQGAKSGRPENGAAIFRIAAKSGLQIQVGGGIRTMDTVKAYLDLGVKRVILGTAAVKEPAFLEDALARYGDQIAVGVDLKDGFVAVNGWTETSKLSAAEFFTRLETLGVQTVICTDISRDGAMKGTNRELYRELSRRFSMDLIASGGVSNLEDVRALKQMGLYGAIIGKAWYTGAIDLAQALEVAR